jgi:hypothetical protein
MTSVLEADARLLQPDSPLAPMDIHLSGFRPMKHMPAQQMEARHFCRQVDADFAQCALFDGNTREANLDGIGYIISARLFETLPAGQCAFRHAPDDGIPSGSLLAPGIPEAVGRGLIRLRMNSYGKTWHVWDTGAEARPGDRLPPGAAHLAWSFNRDGEADPSMLAARDRRTGIETAARREQRKQPVGQAMPRAGVDASKGRFGRETRGVPGVHEAGSRAPRVPDRAAPRSRHARRSADA